MRRSKLILIPAFLIAVLFLATDATQGQGPGGGGFGDGRGPNPDDSFNKLLQSYGGNGDVVEYSKIPPDVRERNNRFAQFSGGAPMPTSGTISRQQYKVEFEQRMTTMQSKMGQGGFGKGGGPPGGGGFGGKEGGGGFGSREGGRGGFGAPTPAPAVPGQPMVVPMGGPQAPGGGNPDEFLRSSFARRDRDGDGRMTMEEASDNFRPVFQQYDANRDGVVDMNEYKPFLEAYTNTRGGNNNERSSRDQMTQYGSQQNWGQQGGNYPPPWGGPQGGPGENRGDRRDPDDARPEVYGYGKQPKGTPAYFDTLDLDKDGQLALYEWRKDTTKTIAGFAELDLNDDGYLTGVEWMRASQLKIERRSAPRGDSEERPRPSMGGGGAPSTTGGGGGPSRTNPFTSGGGAPPPDGTRFLITPVTKEGKDRSNGKGGPTRGKDEPKREGKGGRE